MRRGFTLLEVVVVLAILTLLAALLLPVLGTARARGRQAACVEQLHQLGLAFEMYQQDCNGLPLYLSRIYPGYVNHPSLLICPNDPRQGKFTGNVRLEGNIYLSTGVSYEYIPQWQEALDNGWYQPPPDFGPGKWDDLTPLLGCPWHWAKKFDPNLQHDQPGSNGWELMLTRGGAVRKIRAEDPTSDFSPSKYL